MLRRVGTACLKAGGGKRPEVMVLETEVSKTGTGRGIGQRAWEVTSVSGGQRILVWESL